MPRFYGVPKASGGAVVANVRIVGIPEAIRALTGKDAEAKLSLGALNRTAALAIEAKAKAYCPVITGNLQSSIHSEKMGVYDWEVVASSLEGDIAEKNWYEYAVFVENGTSAMAPRYFMRRAYEEVQPTVALGLAAIARRISV